MGVTDGPKLLFQLETFPLVSCMFFYLTELQKLFAKANLSKPVLATMDVSRGLRIDCGRREVADTIDMVKALIIKTLSEGISVIAAFDLEGCHLSKRATISPECSRQKSGIAMRSTTSRDPFH